MAKNSQNFSHEELKRLANSPTARKLMSLLQTTKPEALSAAKGSAESGDYTAAAAALKTILADPEAAALLAKLGGDRDG